MKLELLHDEELEKKQDRVFRLRDIETQEVSVVDRAANQRRFLVVKRENGMDPKLGAEVTTDDNGDLTAEEIEKAGHMKIPGSVKAKIESALSQAIAVLGKQLAMVKASTEGGPPRIPTAMNTALSMVSNNIDDVMSKYGTSKTKKDGEGDTDADAVAAAAAAAGDGSAEAAADAVTKAAEAAKAELEKAGRSMSSARMARFNDALTALNGLMKEIVGAPKDGDAGNSFTSKVGKSDDTVDPLVEKLTEQINSLTTIVKSTVDSAKRQGEELATLRKSVGESNQSTAEDLDSSAPAEVSWPMDMNEPINKDTTPVSKSFY